MHRRDRIKPIAAGQEVLLNYGKYSAADFLYRYGHLDGEAHTPAQTAHDLAILEHGTSGSGELATPRCAPRSSGRASACA